MEEKRRNALEPMLYLCATPIGNLEDITLRVVRVLESVSRIYCEDTRHTAALLNRLEIKKPLVSCHEHNEKERAEEIVRSVHAGEAVAFVSDAGMPGISDPGERLVAACIRQNVPFTVLPGASAALTALVLSGFPSRGACFYGFLPRETKERREAVAGLAAHRGTLIFYESPLRSPQPAQNSLCRLATPGNARTGTDQGVRRGGARAALCSCGALCRSTAAWRVRVAHRWRAGCTCSYGSGCAGDVGVTFRTRCARKGCGKGGFRLARHAAQ